MNVLHVVPTGAQASTFLRGITVATQDGATNESRLALKAQGGSLGLGHLVEKKEKARCILGDNDDLSCGNVSFYAIFLL
ncbi:hypothetical protein NDU88_004840 [Pleurodeles waltl]|uniref:Uncharacterized protein n=1 Tax=Pleurodeles waltl TaxID=8319 RepID=A0AAV7VLW3_PLEWA|nr:hypothetical protein NDU88_004840 [Pleurodeles waltl]